uniref:Transgelin n=1 Tax=Macrostomum lignano TaxID=282301 RepID=A0A1I8JJZ6_9PLAT
MSAIKPGSIKKINRTTRMPFKLMENIGSFLEAARVYGVPSCDLFQTVDLFEKKKSARLLSACSPWCQAHPDYDGPTLGPKLSEENRRQFTEEQLSAGKNVIGLQAGYNKGASQAGMSFGKARKILD